MMDVTASFVVGGYIYMVHVSLRLKNAKGCCKVRDKSETRRMVLSYTCFGVENILFVHLFRAPNIVDHLSMEPCHGR